MNKSFKFVVTSAALLSLLTGCAVGTPYQRPDIQMPAQWNQSSSNTNISVTSDWWKQFGNAELDQLMQQALAANHDLAAAVSRIEQSRAAATIVAAGRLPSATASANATQSRSTQELGSTNSQSSQVAANVSYELDLWGGKAAESQAAYARLNSIIYDRDAVALVLQGDVASNYFQTLALKDRLAIARKNLDAARNVLALVETRYSKGANTGLEVSQQRTSLLNIAAQIPQLEQDLRTAQTALAVLLGEQPQGFAVKGDSLAGLTIPKVSAYQPPSLLERRPDIKKAEAELIAANADVGAARAALYPTINLSGSVVAGGVLSSGSSVFTSLIASLTQSIFDGGRLQGRVIQSQARKTELVEQYLQSVLTGLKEVHDNLGSVAASESRQSLLNEAEKEAQEAYRIARVRYQAGSIDLLTMLDSQRTQLAAEDSQVQADLARFTATIGLYKSLGGGWDGSNG